eukprot:3938914-Rhodomonas_salina.1
MRNGMKTAAFNAALKESWQLWLHRMGALSLNQPSVCPPNFQVDLHAIVPLATEYDCSSQDRAACNAIEPNRACTPATVPRSNPWTSVQSSETDIFGSNEPCSPSPAGLPIASKVVIRPRRKKTELKLEGAECEPITITIPVLEKLYCKPLNVAAKTLGISVTALKK